METNPCTLGTMHRNCCSSREYSHETMVIPILFHEIPITIITIVENTDTIFLLYSNQHYSLVLSVSVSSYFFYVSSHEGNMVLYATYRTKHNHARE
jgi:hypothetical protein